MTELNSAIYFKADGELSSLYNILGGFANGWHASTRELQYSLCVCVC